MVSVVWRGEADRPEYDEARIRRVFNCQIPERFPRAIAFPASEQEVVDAVNLAITHDCRISVRAGGQSWPVWSVQDDVMLIDLEKHSEMSVDETGMLKVSPSVTGYDLHEFLSDKGWIFSVGHCPNVGVGGALLCGGMGWNCNNWGFAAEHVVAIDAVTAQGQLVHADAHENRDLFWASRGAGPFFPGIVTRFYVKTRRAPKHMRSSGYVYAVRDYKVAFQWILEVAAKFTSGIEAVAVGSYPPGSEEPCITIALLATADDEDSIRTGLQKIEDTHPRGTIEHWFCTETDLRQEFRTKAQAYPPGQRYAVDCTFLRNDADVVSILEPAFTSLPTTQSLVLWNTMIPHSTCKLPDMALSLQSDHYFAMYGVCEPDGNFEPCRRWVCDRMEDISEHELGTYLGEGDLRSRKGTIWSSKERHKLSNIRRARDPQRKFYIDPQIDKEYFQHSTDPSVGWLGRLFGWWQGS